MYALIEMIDCGPYETFHERIVAVDTDVELLIGLAKEEKKKREFSYCIVPFQTGKIFDYDKDITVDAGARFDI